jgi:hypothetical protein
MRTALLATIIVTVCLGVLPAFGVNVTIDKDGMTVVDGERVFVLGLYENPANDADLARAAEAGFNLVRSSESTEALDRLQKHGVWAWINTGYRIDLSADTDNRTQQLKAMVEKSVAHPALAVWEVPDEALWNCWYGPSCWRAGDEPEAQSEAIKALEDKQLAEQLTKQRHEAQRLHRQGFYAESEALADAIWEKLGKKSPKPGYGISTSAERAAKMAEGMCAGYQVLKGLDPNHPVWMNHAPRNQIEQLAAFNMGADAVGCDIYPIPRSPRNGHSDLADRSMASVGGYTDRMQAAAPGKPVWMVLQGFGWDDLSKVEIKEGMEKPRPTLDETRFMAYDSIVHGARAILYWGTAYIEKDSQLWEDLLTLGAELDALQPVLSAPDADLDLNLEYAETFGSLDHGIRVLPKNVDGKVWLIVVNESIYPLTYTLSGFQYADGTRYADEATGNEAVVSQGALTLTISSQSVQILAPK